MTTKEALHHSGKNLQSLRIQKNLSIKALAILSGVDAEIIVEMEAGNFDFYISSIYELAATLNVDFRQILVDPMTFG